MTACARPGRRGFEISLRCPEQHGRQLADSRIQTGRPWAQQCTLASQGSHRRRGHAALASSPTPQRAHPPSRQTPSRTWTAATGPNRLTAPTQPTRQIWREDRAPGYRVSTAGKRCRFDVKVSQSTADQEKSRLAVCDQWPEKQLPQKKVKRLDSQNASRARLQKSHPNTTIPIGPRPPTTRDSALPRKAAAAPSTVAST